MLLIWFCVLRISVSLLRIELRIYVALRPTAVSCETVDRYIIAVRRCYRSIRRMLLTVYTSYFVVYAMMDFSSFVHAAFWICCFVLCICFCLLCVGIGAFVSLYVSEFLTAACGVSPLRGRPKDSALWNPAALERLANFLVSGAGLWVLCVVCCFFTGLLGG